MKLLEKIVSAFIALIMAVVVAAVVGLASKEKVRQHTGGWVPMDFSDLNQGSDKKRPNRQR